MPCVSIAACALELCTPGMCVRVYEVWTHMGRCGVLVKQL